MIYIILYTDALAGDSQFSAGETAGVFVIFHDSHGKEGGGRRLEGWKRGQKGCIFSLEKEFANIVVKDAKISCERHKMASFQNGLYDF